MQVTSKEVPYSRKLSSSLWRDHEPLPFNVIQPSVRCVQSDLEVADLRVLRCCDFLLGVARALERPDHVRLARSDPNLADMDIIEFDLVAACDSQVEWTAHRSRL